MIWHLRMRGSGANLTTDHPHEPIPALLHHGSVRGARWRHCGPYLTMDRGILYITDLPVTSCYDQDGALLHIAHLRYLIEERPSDQMTNQIGHPTLQSPPCMEDLRLDQSMRIDPSPSGRGINCSEEDRCRACVEL